MGLNKVAIKNERPGIMRTPGLRPPDENPDAPEPAEDNASEAKDQKDR